MLGKSLFLSCIVISFYGETVLWVSPLHFPKHASLDPSQCVHACLCVAQNKPLHKMLVMQLRMYTEFFFFNALFNIAYFCKARLSSPCESTFDLWVYIRLSIPLLNAALQIVHHFVDCSSSFMCHVTFECFSVCLYSTG